MKAFPLLAMVALAAFGQSAKRTVYILPMAGGLDQYLAQWLTRDHVMQVVTDAKMADAVLTDRIGEGFEQQMAQIHPADKKSDVTTHHAFRSNREPGTVFLVDAKSRQVLWSDYEKVPGSNSNKSLNREASRIAKKLANSTAK